MKNSASFLKNLFVLCKNHKKRWFKALLTLSWAFYRVALSPHLGGACRFQPSCSVYAFQAFLQFSFFKACRVVIKRLLCCHGFSSSFGRHPVKKDLPR